MIAYNKTKLFHLRLLKKAKQWFKRRLLSDEQFASVTERYKTDLYTPNLFIKIGLFIFTWISVIAAALLFSVFFFGGADSDIAISAMCLLLGAGCIFLLETFIKQKNLYRSGIDEALLYAAIIFVATAIGFLFSDWYTSTSSAILYFTVLMMPLLVAATVRYSDTLVAFALAMCCYVICFLLILKLGAVAKIIMPFAMMLLSAILYIAAKRMKRKQRLQYWQNAIIVFECVGLFLLYASVNYYVIRESGIEYFGLVPSGGQDIPLAILFYLFTALISVLYIFYGLKNKDRIVLWMGLATIALSAITFKYYFSTGFPEILLVIAGLILIGVAYAAMKYLKTPKHEISFEEEMDEDNFLKTNGEAIIQARNFGQPTHVAHTVEFGGGSSGGGGATGNW